MGDDGAPPTPEEHRTPRWVKISGIIALVLVLLLIAVLVFGGGQHGPGRHGGSDGARHGGNHTAPEGGDQHGGSHNGSSDRRGDCMSGGTYNRAFDDAGRVASRCRPHGHDGMVAIQAVQTHPSPDGRHH